MHKDVGKRALHMSAVKPLEQSLGKDEQAIFSDTHIFTLNILRHSEQHKQVCEVSRESAETEVELEVCHQFEVAILSHC